MANIKTLVGTLREDLSDTMQEVADKVTTEWFTQNMPELKKDLREQFHRQLVTGLLSTVDAKLEVYKDIAELNIKQTVVIRDMYG